MSKIFIFRIVLSIIYVSSLGFILWHLLSNYSVNDDPALVGTAHIFLGLGLSGIYVVSDFHLRSIFEDLEDD